MAKAQYYEKQSGLCVCGGIRGSVDLYHILVDGADSDVASIMDDCESLEQPGCVLIIYSAASFGFNMWNMPLSARRNSKSCPGAIAIAARRLGRRGRARPLPGAVPTADLRVN